jgi:ActR/RegA family two-component response regulator
MPRSTHRLLVVDDDVTVARALARASARRGFSVTVAGSSAAACALGQAFDFAILDLDLPDGNGVDLARRLLRAGSVPSVVFFTGSSEPALLARARRLGAVVMKSSGIASVFSCLAPEASDPPQSRTSPNQKSGTMRASASPSLRKSRTR